MHVPILRYEEVLALPLEKHQNPMRQTDVIRLLLKAVSFFDLKAVGFTFEKTGMEKLAAEEPCLILMNHSSFIDLKIVATLLSDREYHIVCTQDGFVGKRLMTTSIDDRYFGYLKSLMEHGVPWREDWVIDDRDSDGVMDNEKEFILPEDMPTAFFCNSDLAASMMYQKLVREGYDVTGDISIVGFDNYLADQFAGIGLTTYEIDTKEMAKRVVHIILHKLLNARYSTGTFVIPGRFIERESVRRIGPPVPFVETYQV